MKLQKLVNRATNLMFNYPTLSLIQRSKNFAKKVIGRDVYLPNCIGWPNGLCALGLLEQIKSNPNTALKRKDAKNLMSYYDRWIRKGMKISRVEDFISGYVLMELMEILDELNISFSTDYEKSVHLMYEYLKGARKDDQGAFVYNANQKEDYVFADMIGMVCPFLAKYAVKYDEAEAVELCMKQINLFVKNSADTKSGLPYHAYEYHGETSVDKLGLLAWGRAVGWIMMGLSGAGEALLQSKERYANEIRSLTEELISYGIVLRDYQREDGLFGWHIVDETGPSDTSATSMILYALSSLKDNAELSAMFNRALQGLIKYVTEDGNVMQGQAECLGIGLHPMKFGSYPWTVGPTLALLSVLDFE